jgi:hypothetical protein
MVKKVVVSRQKALPPPPEKKGGNATLPPPPEKKGANAVKVPPPLDANFRGEEHRQFPRARLAVRFSAWIGEGEDRTFEASFISTNLSVSGAFLESTFFLPVGTEMRVSFELDEDEDPVQARAEIVREERSEGRGGDGRSGFGIRFVEFFAQSEVTLAKLFLGQQLREFAQTYLSSKRAKSLNNELDRVIDALAAWELQKVTSPQDTWREK